MESEQGLKQYYGRDTALRLGARIMSVYPRFDTREYADAVAEGVRGLEFKARLRLMSELLRARLPQPYEAAVEILVASLGQELRADEGIFKEGWFWSPALLFVQLYGLDAPDLSLAALNAMTRRFTAEEAIRPYIQRHFELTMRHLAEWVQSDSFHVRRLVSEGTRPRLPWAVRLDTFVKEPRPALALLEALRDDPVLYVQKSVANHLNDVAKDHPALVLDIAQRWLADSPTDARRWIVRHALRTLIKQGNGRALALMGAEPLQGVRVEAFEVTPAQVTVGESVTLRALLVNESMTAQQLVADYAIAYRTARGGVSRKVYKWTTANIGAGEALEWRKRHAFRPISTRTYYAGAHMIELKVNGEVLASALIGLERGSGYLGRVSVTSV